MRHLALAAVAALAIPACGSKALPTETTDPARPRAPATPSRIETRSFHSDTLGVDKNYVVYLPAGYDDDPTQRWPVLYYLHGLTQNETSWSEGGGIAAAADKLGLRAIIVMPDGDDAMYTDAATDYDLAKCLETGAGLLEPDKSRPENCVKHRGYETYIVKDLLDHIDSTLRTIATRDGRGIAGLSMGGYGALALSLRHKDLFAAAASHSGVDALLYKGPRPYQAGKVELYADPTTIAADFGPIGMFMLGIFGSDPASWKARDPAALVASLAPGELALYLDCGTEDGLRLNDGAAYLHDLLVAKQIDHVFFLGPGKHDFEFWRARLPESLAFLAAHVATPHS